MATEIDPRDSAMSTAAVGPLPSLLDELMTAAQMADVLQMRVSTVEAYARRGVLPSLKVGRHRRFLRSEVERAIIEMAAPGRARR